MPDFPLTNTLIYDFLLEDLDAAGAVVPPNPGDVVTATSSNQNSIAMSIGTMPASAGASAGAPSLHCVPMVIATSGITCTLTDTAGLADATPLSFSVVDSLAPAAIGALLTTFATTPQPRPVAPGP